MVGDEKGDGAKLKVQRSRGQGHVVKVTIDSTYVHLLLSYPLIPSISKPPIQSTSPQFSYSYRSMKSILLSSSHLSFHEDRGSSVSKVLWYKSEGRWFDPSWCQWIFHCHKNPSNRTMALGSTKTLSEMSTRNISWR